MQSRPGGRPPAQDVRTAELARASSCRRLSANFKRCSRRRGFVVHHSTRLDGAGGGSMGQVVSMSRDLRVNSRCDPSTEAAARCPSQQPVRPGPAAPPTRGECLVAAEHHVGVVGDPDRAHLHLSGIEAVRPKRGVASTDGHDADSVITALGDVPGGPCAVAAGAVDEEAAGPRATVAQRPSCHGLRRCGGHCPKRWHEPPGLLGVWRARSHRPPRPRPRARARQPALEVHPRR